MLKGFRQCLLILPENCINIENQSGERVPGILEAILREIQRIIQGTIQGIIQGPIPTQGAIRQTVQEDILETILINILLENKEDQVTRPTPTVTAREGTHGAVK
jgi:hypothetical protein